ncbi:HPP family protein [Methylotenera sp. N17]|jgi:CBS domain-containing membrane protein|uniref:HPP family protein n=1 Tax=Methylotenera sp. N17 TaxID=1502761 RepID=UPI000AFABEB3|nr:HPP family protein [Methylotenera sp. N17]
MIRLYDWLSGFVPEAIVISNRERLRAAIGAFAGIALTAVSTYLITGELSSVPYLIAPMGASAVLLFSLPASPLAQPWSLLGGNLVAALVGVTCAIWIPNPMLAASIAVGASILLMLCMRCLHPPSGAVALTAVLGGPAIHALGYWFVAAPVALNSVILIITAIVFHTTTRHEYPHHARHRKKETANETIPPELRFGFTSDDLNEVLKENNELLYISRDDLEKLFQQTEMHAYRRRFGEIKCRDIMSTEVISVEFGTELEEAWALMRQHKIKALPVVNKSNLVIGIITQIDFMKNANLEVYDNFEVKLKQFIRRTAGHHADKPEVVGQIMSSPVVTASADMHIIELIPLMTQGRVLHHIPVVDSEQRLVGIVTQSDLVSALYHGRLANLRTLGLSS